MDSMVRINIAMGSCIAASSLPQIMLSRVPSLTHVNHTARIINRPLEVAIVLFLSLLHRRLLVSVIDMSARPNAANSAAATIS